MPSQAIFHNGLILLGPTGLPQTGRCHLALIQVRPHLHGTHAPNTPSPRQPSVLGPQPVQAQNFYMGNFQPPLMVMYLSTLIKRCMLFPLLPLMINFT